MLFFNVLRVFKVLHSRTLNQNNALSFSIIASRGRRGRDDLASISIKDFAREYVKVLNIWQNNVGTINRLSNWELAAADDGVSKNAELGANIDLSGKVAGGSLNGVTFGE